MLQKEIHIEWVKLHIHAAVQEGKAQKNHTFWSHYL